MPSSGRRDPPWFALIRRLLSLRLLECSWARPEQPLSSNFVCLGPEAARPPPGSRACGRRLASLVSALAAGPRRRSALTVVRGDRVRNAGRPSPSSAPGPRPLAFWSRCAPVPVFGALRGAPGPSSFRPTLPRCAGQRPQGGRGLSPARLSALWGLHPEVAPTRWASDVFTQVRFSLLSFHATSMASSRIPATGRPVIVRDVHFFLRVPLESSRTWPKTRSQGRQRPGSAPRGQAGQPAVGLGIRERVTRPVCFSVGFVLPIGIFPDASDAKFEVTRIPQMGAGQRDPPPLCGRRASWCEHFLMGGRVWQLPGPQHRLWPRWALVGVPTQCRPAPPATRRPRLFLWLADLFSRLLLGSSAGLAATRAAGEEEAVSRGDRCLRLRPAERASSVLTVQRLGYLPWVLTIKTNRLWVIAPQCQPEARSWPWLPAPLAPGRTRETGASVRPGEPGALRCPPAWPPLSAGGGRLAGDPAPRPPLAPRPPPPAPGTGHRAPGTGSRLRLPLAFRK